MKHVDTQCLERTLKHIVRMFVQGRLVYRETPPAVLEGVRDIPSRLETVRRLHGRTSSAAPADASETTPPASAHDASAPVAATG